MVVSVYPFPSPYLDPPLSPSSTHTPISFIFFSFAGYAPWSPRGWHGTTVYNNTIWMIGGTPLNSEVWVLTGITRLEEREPPLTRAMYILISLVDVFSSNMNR